MYMHPLKPGVTFKFEVTGPIDSSEKWTFEEFYKPEDRQGPLKDIFRKYVCLAMVNKAISYGRINEAGVWQATIIRKRMAALSIRVRRIGPPTIV